MTDQYNQEILDRYKNEMERRAIEQAQDFLRRYGMYPPTIQPSPVAAPAPVQGSNDLVTIPVTSVEQAENAPIDVRTFIFPNLQCGEIYVKRIDDTGKAVIQTYLPKGVDKMEKQITDNHGAVIDLLSRIIARLEQPEGKPDEQS